MRGFPRSLLATLLLSANTTKTLGRRSGDEVVEALLERVEDGDDGADVGRLGVAADAGGDLFDDQGADVLQLLGGELEEPVLVDDAVVGVPVRGARWGR